MVIGSAQIVLYAEWVNSLKEKRMELKKIIERCKNRFNISIAETGSNDKHRTMEIGFACVSNDAAVVNSVMENVIDYIERITDASIEDIITEVI